MTLLSQLVDIIIPVYNQPELTYQCLKSINQFVKPALHIIVVDNNSDIETCKRITEASKDTPHKFTIIKNSENLGFSRAVNQGLESGKGKLVCILNNDTIVHKGWLTEMIRVLETEPDIGLINPEGTRGYKRFSSGGSFPYIEMGTLSGYCIFGKRFLLEKVEGFDEAYSPFLWEDTDLCRKVQKLGYRCVLVPDAYVDHIRSSTLNRVKQSYRQKVAERNRTYYLSKWGKSLRVICFLEGIKSELALPYKSLISFFRQMANVGHHIELYISGNLPADIFFLADMPFHVNISVKRRRNVFGLSWPVRWIEGRCRGRKDDMLITDSRLLFLALSLTGTKAAYLLRNESLVSNNSSFSMNWNDFLSLHQKQGLLNDVIM